MRFGAVLAWARSNPWPAAASLAGVVFIAASFAVGGQWSAVMLEVGAGLGLVVIVFALEQRMSRQLQARQDAKLDRLEEKLVSRFEGPPQQAAAEVVRRSRDDVESAVSAFEADPTPETLSTLVGYAMAVDQPAATQVEVAPGWVLNIGVSRNPYQAGESPRPVVQLKVINQSENREGEAVNWRDDTPYGDMLDTLRTTWIKFSNQWPGDEAFMRIDFPRLIASGFVESIERAARGSNTPR